MIVDALPFDDLSPDVVLQSVESVGLACDGRLMALNSYENRVYRLGIDPLPADNPDPGIVPDAAVVKFYRPGRWTDAQLREEHEFALELVAAGLPVAAPLRLQGRCLHHHGDQRFAVFECRRGGAPELDAPGARELLGRTLGRVHAVGGRRVFQYRERVSDARCGARARSTVLGLTALPDAVRGAYSQVSAALVDAISLAFAPFEGERPLRLHGDCHLGNILWSATGPVFVDLDDCRGGPAVQDLWMFLSGGSPDTQRAEWAQLLEGYTQFADFDYAQTALIEPLRALRMLEHTAWVGSRWRDPAFPRAFPWIAEPRWWERHVADLRDQVEALADPPLLRSW